MTNIKILLLQNHWANFIQTLHKSFLGEGNSSCLNKGPLLFPRGDNFQIVKIHKIEDLNKSSSPEPLGQFQANLQKASRGKEDLSLFKRNCYTFYIGR